MAAQAKFISKDQEARETPNIHIARQTIRRETKHALIFLSTEQLNVLLTHDDSQQGKRDALMLLLMLDHGLRVDELAGLQVSDFNLLAGTLTFYRPKTKGYETCTLTEATAHAARAYFEYAPDRGSLWRQCARSFDGKAMRGN